MVQQSFGLIYIYIYSLKNHIYLFIYLFIHGRSAGNHGFSPLKSWGFPVHFPITNPMKSTVYAVYQLKIVHMSTKAGAESKVNNAPFGHI